jgi:hypothetical protein
VLASKFETLRRTQSAALRTSGVSASLLVARACPCQCSPADLHPDPGEPPGFTCGFASYLRRRGVAAVARTTFPPAALPGFRLECSSHADFSWGVSRLSVVSIKVPSHSYGPLSARDVHDKMRPCL